MVACIVVNYRSPLDMLRTCLESIVREGGTTPCRIVLVDNGSGDGVAARLPEMFPGIEVVGLPDNLGFAAAVNRGLDRVDRKSVV